MAINAFPIIIVGGISDYKNKRATEIISSVPSPSLPLRMAMFEMKKVQKIPLRTHRSLRPGPM